MLLEIIRVIRMEICPILDLALDGQGRILPVRVAQPIVGRLGPICHGPVHDIAELRIGLGAIRVIGGIGAILGVEFSASVLIEKILVEENAGGMTELVSEILVRGDVGHHGHKCNYAFHKHSGNP